ncbi:GNAT family N-acetyltransferase [bacterium]|nr:GNAT family N-acetyltransferase [bacterium]
MRRKLWPDTPPELEEAERLRAKPSYLIWVAEQDADIIGFLEAQTCNRADGCVSDSILYIEGWFVEEPFRHQGIGSALMQAAEEWARAHNILELGSDALLDNTISHRAHKKLGFHEVDRQISYAKKL